MLVDLIAEGTDTRKIDKQPKATLVQLWKQLLKDKGFNHYLSIRKQKVIRKAEWTLTLKRDRDKPFLLDVMKPKPTAGPEESLSP